MSAPAAPAVAPDGTIYIGNGGGFLNAIDADGTLKWVTKAGGSMKYCSPAIAADGTIYIGSRTGLTAVNPDGTIQWNFVPSGAAIQSTPAIATDGTIYVGSRGNAHGIGAALFALDPNGNVLWSYGTGAESDGSPAIGADGVIYTVTGNRVIAVNPDGPCCGTIRPAVECSRRRRSARTAACTSLQIASTPSNRDSSWIEGGWRPPPLVLSRPHMALLDLFGGGAPAIHVGDRAPDFALPDRNGRTVRLGDYRGKKAVVLYFYPKDDTPGCTKEACAFRDQYQDLQDAGAEVIGVSSDGEAAHERFATKYKLPFVLVTDRGGAVRKQYGVPATLGLLPGRVTFVIDRQGVVRHVFNSQFQATKHVAEAITALRAMEGAK